MNAFNHPWTYPPALMPLVLSSFLVKHVTGQFRLLILVAPYWMEAPWLPSVLNILGDIPQHFPVIKGLDVNVLVGHVLKGLPYLYLTLWMLRDMCCTDKGSLPSLSGSGKGNSIIDNKYLPAMLERTDR